MIYDYLFKFIASGTLVVLITHFAKTGNSAFAGLIVFFPIISIVSYFIIGKTEGEAHLKDLVIYTFLSIPPLLAYLGSLIYFLNKFSFIISLTLSTAIWIIVAFIIFNFRSWL